jgi:phosphoadenosine phosphosulfate reductase
MAVERLVNTYGPNLFYQSLQLRRRCCHVRKVQPLRRALRGLKAWICGLRIEQSITRRDLEPITWDQTYGIIKVCPLTDWTTEQVWQYIHDHNVPYNRLHDVGYTSIGCAPCTRPVLPGEDIRAGRWWWEGPEHKECGLHRITRQGG